MVHYLRSEKSVRDDLTDSREEGGQARCTRTRGGTSVGRWKTYKSAKAFLAAVEDYFKKITYKEPARRPGVWMHGKYIAGEEIKDCNGNPILLEQYIVPPSIVALQNHIGVSRETWSNYSDEEGYAEVIEYARRRVEEYLNRQLIEMGRDNKGVIFSLENNFGYREKREDTVHQTSADISDTLTPEEKLEALRKLELIHEGAGDDP